MPTAREIAKEEYRQAKAIHGGLWGYCVAKLGVTLSRLPLPTKRLRLALYRNVFGKKYPPGLDETEAERPLHEYPTLNAVFTRGLVPECRPIPKGTPDFLSPCDSTVQDVGRIDHGQIMTLKGIPYSLESLLSGVDIAPFEGGNFAILFLSPIDCHRVFAPQDGHLEEAIHVPGSRLLVHPPFQRPEFPVYTLNERMIFRFRTPLGPSIVVMVAGWGVGNITLPSAPHFRPRGRSISNVEWSLGQPIARGDWFATFELGSTVVLLTPPNESSECLLEPNQKVKYGQPVYRYPEPTTNGAAQRSDDNPRR